MKSTTIQMENTRTSLSPARSDLLGPCTPTVILHDTGWSFSCRPGQPLLEAAYEAGIALPYACRRGICGLCATPLMSGEVHAVDTLPMTNARCGPGEVLLCRCTAVSPRVIIHPPSSERLPAARRLPPLHAD